MEKRDNSVVQGHIVDTHKYIEDFRVTHNLKVSADVALLRLVPEKTDVNLADMSILPGQFVQVQTPDNATFLRRPISVCNVDLNNNELWLLVRNAGEGSKAIMGTCTGEILNLILPLGNGFSCKSSGETPLLIGGGVGAAPLLFLGVTLNASGIRPTFLIGARNKSMLLLQDELTKYGDLHISTDDGSCGSKGLVTENEALDNNFSSIYCCGPLPMMKAVARIAAEKNIPCEVSLENVMGCGIGACLCCVEKTVYGNLCVCKEGPVFNINKLLW